MEYNDPLTTSVSVIIPTWNRWPRVQEAIDSVLAQTLKPQEIIVVDDGSDDGTTERLQAAYRHRAQLKLLRSENRGVSAARNLGIATSQGQWLAFLDSDDLWQEDKLARQLAALDEAKQAGEEYKICHCDEIWIRRGRRVNPRLRHGKLGGWIYPHCLPLCAISPSAVLIHRRIFEFLGTFDESLPACEDYDLWLRLTAQYPVLYVDQPLVTKHGGHEDQLSRTTPALDRYRIQALDKSLKDSAVVGDNRRQALVMLVQKIDIYSAGVRKRGRDQEADDLQRLRAFWLDKEG